MPRPGSRSSTGARPSCSPRSPGSRSGSSPGAAGRSPRPRCARHASASPSEPECSGSSGSSLIATGVPVYVILPAYAILFLLALPLVSLGARALFVLAAALAVVMPFVQVLLDSVPFWSTPVGQIVSVVTGWHYPFPVWIAFVVAGLAAARAGITRMRVQLWLVGAGAALAVVGLRPGRRGRGGCGIRRRLVRRRGLDRRPALQRPARSDRVGRVRARRDRAVPARVPERAHLDRAAAASGRGDAAHGLYGAARGLGDRGHRGARRPGRSGGLPRSRRPSGR